MSEELGGEGRSTCRREESDESGCKRQEMKLDFEKKPRIIKNQREVERIMNESRRGKR